MATYVQNKANMENAQKSTGPHDTSKTRFNASIHNLRSKTLFEMKYRDEIGLHFEELKETFLPSNNVEEALILDMAVQKTRIDMAGIYQMEVFEISKLRRKSAQIVSRKTAEWAESLDVDIHRLSTEEYQEYKKAKKEEEEVDSKRVSFPNPAIELACRYENEARNQLIKLMRFYVELKPFWVRLAMQKQREVLLK